MSEFQSRFDALLPEANSAISNRTTALGNAHFGIHPNQIRRLLERISQYLGNVDRRNLANPEYLASATSNVPERAIEIVSAIPASLTDGVDPFIHDTLPTLVSIEQSLARAVGVNAIKIGDIKQAQVRKLDQIIDWASQRYNETKNIKLQIDETNKNNSELKSNLDELYKSAHEDLAKIKNIRAESEKLSSGNAARNPLEKLVRLARDKVDEINEVVSSAQIAKKGAQDAVSTISDRDQVMKEALKRLEQTDEKARQILSTATQAGLAGAYKQEREKLEKQQKYFAYVFYGIISFSVLYAAVFILPIVKDLIDNSSSSTKDARDNALLLFVRFLILTPAIWALIFTNRRYVYLETLQMDYAAKTATALAYFGYKDEMDDDDGLSKRLKDGLVARFLEHPSRLLGKKMESSSSEVGPEGARVRTETHTPGALPDAGSELGAELR